MPLLKSVVTPGSVQLSYHVAARIEGALNQPTLAVHVQSWPSENARYDAVAFSHVWYVPVPIALLAGPLNTAVEQVLATHSIDGNPFVGASVVPERGNLEAAKALKWAMIKQTRDMLAQTPIAYAGSVFDADERSVSNVRGALQGLTLSQSTEPIIWTLADNSTRSLSLQDLQGLALEIFSRTDQLYSTARTLRAAVDAAQSVDDVMAVAWPA